MPHSVEKNTSVKVCSLGRCNYMPQIPFPHFPLMQIQHSQL